MMTINFNQLQQGSDISSANVGTTLNQLGVPVSPAVQIPTDGIVQMVSDAPNEAQLTAENLQAHNQANGSNVGSNTPPDASSEHIYGVFIFGDFENSSDDGRNSPQP